MKLHRTISIKIVCFIILQSVLFGITSPRTLVLRRGDVESVAQGEGNTTGIIVLHLTEHHAIAIERDAVDTAVEEVVT